jgi:hypothetical protein
MTQGANLENQTTAVECRYRPGCFSIAPPNKPGRIWRFGVMVVPKFRAESRASRRRDEHVTVLTGGGRMGVAVPLPLQSLPSECGLNHLLSPKLFEIRNGYEMKRMYVRFAKKIK